MNRNTLPTTATSAPARSAAPSTLYLERARLTAESCDLQRALGHGARQAEFTTHYHQLLAAAGLYAAAVRHDLSPAAAQPIIDRTHAWQRDQHTRRCLRLAEVRTRLAEISAALGEHGAR